MPASGPSETAAAVVMTSSAVADAVQEKHSPQPIAHSPSIEASAAAKETAAAEVAALSNAVAAVQVNEVAASAPAASTPAAPTGAPAAAVVPVVPSSLDEPVKGENGELINGGFKRGGAENDPTTGYYDEVELEDFEYDEEKDEYSYPCPCGDRFRISKEDMLDGEDIARCASCSLLLKVIFDPEDLEED